MHSLFEACKIAKVTEKDLLADSYYSKIINTGAFQRLKEISFLGAIDHAYKFKLVKSQRSRHEHSLSVARLALNVSRTRNYSIEVERHLVTAALLHDIGHMPLSHSVEPAVRRARGLDHHLIGSRIISGDYKFSKDLQVILRKHVDPEVVNSLVTGTSDFDGGELFSDAINIDTIDGIIRAAKYAGLNFGCLSSELVCNHAFITRNEKSIGILDGFWGLKGLVYSQFILNQKGLIADALSARYFEDNQSRFSDDDFVSNELDWKKKHHKLFSYVDRFDEGENCELEPIFITNRNYVVDKNAPISSRYKCNKTKVTYSFAKKQKGLRYAFPLQIEGAFCGS